MAYQGYMIRFSEVEYISPYRAGLSGIASGYGSSFPIKVEFEAVSTVRILNSCPMPEGLAELLGEDIGSVLGTDENKITKELIEEKKEELSYFPYQFNSKGTERYNRFSK